MDYKKIKTNQEAITRDVDNFNNMTGNLYESVVILSKRANQISLALRQELMNKISSLAPPQSAVGEGFIEEVFENREQIEIAHQYEQLPKATLMAIQEFLDDDLRFRRMDEEEKLK
ncbi:MAG: DNA-directed RNA polymerase subunit omega [Bacteroidales bacterium]|jgi:DNA-directed RNA polymerase subunit K/omega|nr:DNA-directed RNA polymerase subunit omega [Bacteroidales bacterium]